MRVPLPAVMILQLAGLALSAATAADRRPDSVVIEAGEFDRHAAVVSVPMPRLERPPNAVVVHGRLAPLQFDSSSNRAWFVSGPLRKGQRTVYTLTNAARVPAAGSWSLAREGRAICFKPQQFVRPGLPPLIQPDGLLEYQAEPGPFPRDNIPELFRRGGYLHPLRTRSGRMVTDDFPRNHLHHHGVWWAWTRTEFDGRKPDFWNMGQGKGRVEFVAVDGTWQGPVHGGFQSRHRFVDLTAPQPAVALEESWEVTVYDLASAGPNWWFFDLVSTQRCATASPLRLPEYHYGGIGLRGNWAWNGATNAQFLTSDGETNRVKAHAQRSRWCDVSGSIDNAIAGIAVLGHPSNFRAPQPMRIHPDEPFFCYAPQQLGGMEIKPGESYVSRYRFVIHDGPMTRAELDRLWNDFAHPPVARLAAE